MASSPGVTIGIELTKDGIVAVRVGEAGDTQAHATAGREADVVASAWSAIRSVGGTPPPTVIGVACDGPDALADAAALAASSHGNGARVCQIVPSGTAAAVAEAWIGAARGSGLVVFFGAGAHASAGLVKSGAPVLGAHRRGPAVGWLSLNPVEREDYRKTGCLEAEVAASGIVRRLIWRVKAGDRSRVEDAVNGDLSAIGIGHVLAAARDGDGVSISVVRDTAKYLGMAAANLIAISDPEVMVLGGLMASAADLFFEPVRTEIVRRLPAPMMQEIEVVAARLGDTAPAVGAARLAAQSPS